MKYTIRCFPTIPDGKGGLKQQELILNINRFFVDVNSSYQKAEYNSVQAAVAFLEGPYGVNLDGLIATPYRIVGPRGGQYYSTGDRIRIR